MAAKKKKPTSRKTKLPASSLVESLQSKYGKSVFNTDMVGVEKLPTKIMSIDYVAGGVGFPRGKVTEIFGTESSGKTSLALKVCAQTQEEGKMVCYIDAEAGFQPELAHAIGVDTSPDKFVLCKPMSGEDALELCDEFIQASDIGVIVIDSVPALITESEFEGDIRDVNVGGQARLMSKFMKMVIQKLDRSECIVIFINQIREKIGVMYGSPETTPGGRALPFYSSLRIKTRKVGTIEEAGEPVGIKIAATNIKNKIGIPYRKAEYSFYFDTGFSAEADLIENALKFGICQSKGAWIYYNKEESDPIRLGQGRSQSEAFLRDNPALQDEIYNAVVLAFNQ